MPSPKRATEGENMRAMPGGAAGAAGTDVGDGAAPPEAGGALGGVFPPPPASGVASAGIVGVVTFEP